MAVSTQSAAHTIAKLESARKLALGDAAYYPKIVPGVLPFFGLAASLSLKRWGADFLAETFASPALAEDEKKHLSLEVLDTVKDFLEIPGGDTSIVKSAVQTATSIYPLVFKHVISNISDNSTWHKMAAIKSNILRRMDTAPAGVQICCVKFIQSVVQVQTPGLIADPRRPEQNELSLALVPRDHPLLPPPTLEAEAIGLLDRLLSVFQEITSDALLVTATLNSVGVLVRTRPNVASKILNAVLNFNPFQVANGSLAARHKVMVKSLERTTRAFLLNINKRSPNHPLAGRIHGYLEKLQQMRVEGMLDEKSRKRPAPNELPDGLEKRQQLGSDRYGTPPRVPDVLVLPPGPISVAQLFTVTREAGTRSFDVQSIPIDLVNKILVPILASINQTQMESAVNVVRTRLLAVTKPQATSMSSTIPTAEFTNAGARHPESAEKAYLQNKGESMHGAATQQSHAVLAGPVIIPQPPPLTEAELDESKDRASLPGVYLLMGVPDGNATVRRVFGMMTYLDDPTSTKATLPGFNRLAASRYNRDSWVTVVSRLATRAGFGIEQYSPQIKQERNSSDDVRHSTFAVTTAIREALHEYILEDFRRRVDVAISWLNEEWYNDRLRSRAGDDVPLQYDKWVLKVLDGMLPYLDAKDKLLIRFLSEVPAINQDILERVKRLALDPERVSLACNAIHYLILFRPPVRDICIDALEDLWRNYDDARAVSGKLLIRWRPHLVPQTGKGMDAKALQALSATAVA